MSEVPEGTIKQTSSPVQVNKTVHIIAAGKTLSTRVGQKRVHGDGCSKSTRITRIFRTPVYTRVLEVPKNYRQCWTILVRRNCSKSLAHANLT